MTGPVGTPRRGAGDRAASGSGQETELFVFGRFRARAGHEDAVAEALLEVLLPTREEPGCLGIHVYRSRRDPRLFYLHSRWRNEPAFDLHADLPHTVRFLERVAPLLEHALDVTRAERIG